MLLKKYLLIIYWAYFAFKRTQIKKTNRMMELIDPYSYFMHESIIDLSKAFSKDKIVLDVGSGGQWARNFFETNSNKYLGCDVESSDYSGIQDFLVLDEILPLESNSLDLIISNSVLEHLKKPDAAIAEWYRVLKPGGCLFLQTNFLYQEHCSPDDYFRFSINGLRELLNRENFEIKLSKKIGKRFTFSQQLLLGWWISKLEIPLVKFFDRNKFKKLVFLPILFATWVLNLSVGFIICLVLIMQSLLGNLQKFDKNSIYYTGVAAYAYKPLK